MEWISSWFYSTPVVAKAAEASTIEATEVVVLTVVPTVPKAEPEADTESNPPELVPIQDPDPDEYSGEPDSKCQIKTRATQEYEKRCSKRARNKARRARGKGITDQ